MVSAKYLLLCFKENMGYQYRLKQTEPFFFLMQGVTAYIWICHINFTTGSMLILHDQYSVLAFFKFMKTYFFSQLQKLRL